MTKTSQDFGAWPSDISPKHVAGKTLRLGLLQSQGDFLYWTECRPAEQGRCVIMRCKTFSFDSNDTQAQELLPPPFSARSSVHEYGSGEFFASEDTLFFVNAQDQQIYALALPEYGVNTLDMPIAITQNPTHRFTDICLDRRHNRLICVAEIHAPTIDNQTKQAPTNCTNCLVTIDLQAPIEERVTPLVQGHDFYASPTLSPSNNTLAWLSWNLPQMPWEGAALHIGTLSQDGTTLTEVSQIVGDGTSAVFQPQWHADGSLYFIWDKSGWGNLYRWTLDKSITDNPDHLLDLPYDFGQPQWVFGMKKYAILPNGLIALTFTKQGRTKTGSFNPENSSFSEDKDDKYSLTGLEQVVATTNGFAGLALHHDQPQAVSEFITTTGKSLTLRASAKSPITEQNISKGEAICFKNQKQQDVFGVFYPPTHQDYQGKADTLPPCIFNVHGGPSAAVSRGLNLKIQYWTNRGFAWCDIDYSGSTGYGKAYRQRLDGQWGIADVDDIISGAKHLIRSEKIHPKQCVITGSSAGGLTVLNTLATSTIFAAGASYYGVTDLLKLQETTHKFEAGYLFNLIGCTAENYKSILPSRSPSALADKITAPVIFFQGENDPVVPLEQAQSMHDALKKNSITTQLFIFEGEGHGFRKAETIMTTLEQEFQFYTQIFNKNNTES